MSTLPPVVIAAADQAAAGVQHLVGHVRQHWDRGCETPDYCTGPNVARALQGTPQHTVAQLLKAALIQLAQRQAADTEPPPPAG